MPIKTNCEYWEFETKNECYMFKPHDCDSCEKYTQKTQRIASCIGPTGIRKTLLIQLLMDTAESEPIFFDSKNNEKKVDK